MNANLEKLASWINRHDFTYAEIQDDCVMVETEYSFRASNGALSYGKEYHYVRTLEEARRLLGY